MRPVAKETAVEGVVLVQTALSSDARGSFGKIYHPESYLPNGFALREAFYSRSSRGVIRGMHFQTPPSDHDKIVTCLGGRIYDVCLDLRSSSRTYGRSVEAMLTPGGVSTVRVPPGVAHGFQAMEDDVLVLYLTTAEHDPERDQGVDALSFGVDWPVPEIIRSPRDEQFPALDTFESPFP